MAETPYSPSVQSEGLPGRAFPRLPEDVSPAEQGAGIGQGIQNAGEALQSVQDRMDQQANRTAVTGAVTSLEVHANNLIYDPKDGALAKQGADALNLAPTYLPQIDAQAKQIAGGLANEKQRDAFMSAYMQRLPEYGRLLNTHELQQQKDYQDTVDKAALASTYQTAGLSQGDPQILARARQDVEAIATNSMERRGINDPAAIAEGVQHAYSGMHAAVVRGMITNGDSQGASNYLYQNMPEMDINTAESLQRLTLNSAAHDEAQQNRLIKQNSDSLAKQGDDLLRTGRMSPTWLENHRDQLERPEYQYFTNKLMHPEENWGPGDPKMFSALTLSALSGTDVNDQARAALLKHQITDAQFQGIVKDVSSERPGWYKRGAIFLDQALDPGQLNPDPAAHLSKANALADWQQWASRHPDATDDQALSQQRLLSLHYAIVAHEKSTFLLQAPSFMVGPTRAQIDLPATSKATMDALGRGEITQEQAQQQADLLAQYRTTMAATAKAQADAAAKRKAK